MIILMRKRRKIPFSKRDIFSVTHINTSLLKYGTTVEDKGISGTETEMICQDLQSRSETEMGHLFF